MRFLALPIISFFFVILAIKNGYAVTETYHIPHFVEVYWTESQFSTTHELSHVHNRLSIVIDKPPEFSAELVYGWNLIAKYRSRHEISGSIGKIVNYEPGHYASLDISENYLIFRKYHSNFSLVITINILADSCDAHVEYNLDKGELYFRMARFDSGLPAFIENIETAEIKCGFSGDGGS